MSDRVTVPFAITAGLSGVLNTNHLIIVSGLSEIIAGCIYMGLGGYLAGQSEVEVELDMEFATIFFAAAQLMSLGSKKAAELCMLCADMCEACASECSKHNYAHCKECAQLSRECAAECRNM